MSDKLNPSPKLARMSHTNEPRFTMPDYYYRCSVWGYDEQRKVWHWHWLYQHPFSHWRWSSTVTVILRSVLNGKLRFVFNVSVFTGWTVRKLLSDDRTCQKKLTGKWVRQPDIHNASIEKKRYNKGKRKVRQGRTKQQPRGTSYVDILQFCCWDALLQFYSSVLLDLG